MVKTTNFDNVVKELNLNRFKKINCIPTKFSRFSKVFPGILQSTYYIITANSGIGKSKLAKKIFIYDVLEYLLKNPEFPVKIFYFSLEENKQKFILSTISYFLYKIYGVRLSTRELRSIYSNKKLSDENLTKIKSLKELFVTIDKYVEVIDYFSNPFGIYNYMRNYAKNNGKFFLKGEEISNPRESMYDQYTPNNPEEYVIVMTDHVSLLSTERGNTLRDSIGVYSSDYSLKMRDNFGYTVVNIQQQASDKERQEYTNKGESIEQKLEPSLDSLADNRTTQRDADIVLGLFAPERYEIRDHRGYSIIHLQDYYRQLSILKDRDGESNARIGLFFDGKTGEFKELPKADDYEKLKITYELIKKYNAS